MMSRLETDDRDSVAAEIRNSGRRRGRMPQAPLRRRLGGPEGYDLSLNTERMTVDQCAEEIIQLARQPEFCETDESRKGARDLALQANVRAALRADSQTRSLSSRWTPTTRKCVCAASSRRVRESNSAARVVMAVRA